MSGAGECLSFRLFQAFFSGPRKSHRLINRDLKRANRQRPVNDAAYMKKQKMNETKVVTIGCSEGGLNYVHDTLVVIITLMVLFNR